MNKLKIIALAETWLKDKSNISQTNMTGYSELITRSRAKKRDGGVAMIISYGFKFRKKTDHEGVEILFLKTVANRTELNLIPLLTSQKLSTLLIMST